VVSPSPRRERNATNRITVDCFRAEGGDHFAVLEQGTNRPGGAADTHEQGADFEANSRVARGPQNRMTVAP
jgi:5'-nucleotidase